ncbi:hypothetical protein QTG54_002222 [Skeletonema marinoi]|uniref:F-box domain-containing protein n=1 Tax=Skeletonema marinoi TaxID=267567 RepID=A0AAD9DIK5_9STRA|nr:hypothetical protein QTG54_002222 [Skeletonema marinoi]
MSTALPNLQQLSICGGHKYSDGQDAIEATAAITADDTIHGIGMLSKFTKLRVLEIGDANYLTGSLGDLSPLKNTLEKVCIQKCRNISGNFMELADFPRLKELDLHNTAVTGDIQDICVDDFPVLERLSLPKNVRGGRGYEFQHVNEVPTFMHTIYVLLQRTPTLFTEFELSRAFDWRLSEDSPDWYADDELAKLIPILPLAPFQLRFIQSGSRRGWRWCNSKRNDSCEINWFGPEPSSDEIEEFLRRNVVGRVSLHRRVSLLLPSSGSHFAMQSTASAPESSNNMHLDNDETPEVLGTDEVAIIFGFLSPYDIMRARVCKTWRDAAKKTVVPPSDEYVEIHDPRSYNAVRVMSTALPNLEQLMISKLGSGHVYSDGDDPEEWDIDHINHITHDIDIISRFRKLRILDFFQAPLTGRYPVLFNFPLLQELSISYCQNLKFDLDMLRGFPLLEVLNVGDNQHLTGNISSLSPLKNTLKKLHIWTCLSVRGDFMDLADFSRLKNLFLYDTHVTGDIRDIKANDFPALESFYLPNTVHGGVNYEFRDVAEVPSFMHALHLLSQRTPALFSKDFLSEASGWKLSKDSPDWYEEIESVFPKPPFHLQFVRAGSRRGWSWCDFRRVNLCEINWLDPEPCCESSDYGTYIKELQDVERCVGFYRGYYQPPTEAEYRRLIED